MKKRHSTHYRIAIVVLIIGSMLEVFLLFLIYCFPDGVPKIQSYRFVIAENETMVPSISKGSLVIVKEDRHNKEYEKDDIIAFQTLKHEIELTRIVERIIQNDEIYYQTKKEINTTIDPSNVSSETVLGKLQMQIPYAGTIGKLLISQGGILCISAILIVNGYIVFVKQESEVEVEEVMPQEKAKKEELNVHITKISNETIERTVVSPAGQQKKVVQAVLPPREIKQEVMKPIRTVEPQIQKRQEPVHKERVTPRPVTQMRSKQEMKPIQPKPQPIRPQAQPMKQRAPINRQERVMVREQPIGKPRPKVDVREQLALQRQRIKEETERLMKAKEEREKGRGNNM